MIRVTHIYKQYFPEMQGGLEETIRQIANFTTNRGISNTILTTTNIRMPYSQQFHEAKIIKYKQDFRILSTPISFEFFSKFKTEIRNTDLLHFHFPWPFGELCYLLSSTKKPVIVTYHSDIVKQKNVKKVYKVLMNKFLEKANVIVATSNAYINSSKDLRPYRSKCVTIPLTIKADRFPSVNMEKSEKEVEDNHGKDYFLFVGVLRYYKGLEYLIKAMKNVDNLLLIAGKGPEELKLKYLVQKHNINNVKFLGHVSDRVLPALYSLCKAFVFPSCERSEAFGVSLLEASYFGKAMISTELNTGTSYVNKHNETGLVVPAKNIPALQNALNILNRNEELCLLFGNNAKERLKNKFDSNMVLSQYIDIYKRVIKKNTCSV